MRVYELARVSVVTCFWVFYVSDGSDSLSASAVRLVACRVTFWAVFACSQVRTAGVGRWFGCGKLGWSHERRATGLIAADVSSDSDSLSASAGALARVACVT
eukprot:COSAG02_NODE_2438_length_8864_cov_23.127781_1_plen_102_part_00